MDKWQTKASNYISYGQLFSQYLLHKLKKILFFDPIIDGRFRFADGHYIKYHWTVGDCYNPCIVQVMHQHEHELWLVDAFLKCAKIMGRKWFISF